MKIRDRVGGEGSIARIVHCAAPHESPNAGVEKVTIVAWAASAGIATVEDLRRKSKHVALKMCLLKWRPL